MRCQGDLKADDALHLAPEGRLPAIDLELLGIELYCGHGRIRADLLVRSGILWPQVEPAPLLVRSVGKAIDGKTQVRQNLVIDDIVKKDGIRVEGFLRQDDAIVELAVLADSDVPGIAESLL